MTSLRRRATRIAVAVCVFAIAIGSLMVASPAAHACLIEPSQLEEQQEQLEQREQEIADLPILDRWLTEWIAAENSCGFKSVVEFPTQAVLGVGISVLGLAIGARVLVRSKRGALDVPSEPDPEAVSA